MAGTTALCAADIITEICKKEHIISNAEILETLKDQFCDLNTVNFIDSDSITDNGDDTYTIPVTNPAADSLVIDDNLFIYEFDGQDWTLKYSPKQSDWDQADNTEIDYIKNKPENLSDFNNDLDTDDIPEGAVNKYYTENRVQNNPDVSANTAARHTHPNKALLDSYDQTNTDISGAIAHVSETNNPHGVTKSQVGLGNVTNVAQIPLSEKGTANGVAETDGSNKILSQHLPSYVDDVLEFADFASFPATGEDGKIYVAEDTNLTYRWTGSVYVEISASLALGETSSTAYRGDRGKTAYDHSQETSGNPHNVSKNEIGLGNVDNTSDANKPVSTAQQTEIDQAEADAKTYTDAQISSLATVASSGDSTDLVDSSDIVRNDQDSYSSEPKVAQIITLTQAEKDAIVTPVTGALYIIPEP